MDIFAFLSSCQKQPKLLGRDLGRLVPGCVFLQVLKPEGILSLGFTLRATCSRAQEAQKPSLGFCKAREQRLSRRID